MFRKKHPVTEKDLDDRSEPEYELEDHRAVEVEYRSEDEEEYQVRPEYELQPEYWITSETCELEEDQQANFQTEDQYEYQVVYGESASGKSPRKSKSKSARNKGKNA